MSSRSSKRKGWGGSVETSFTTTAVNSTAASAMSTIATPTPTPLALTSSMLPKSLFPEHDRLDKRLPPEIWIRIFKGLYPSQLCRLSRVNKTFLDLVSSLDLWKKIFTTSHASNQRLRTLRGMSQSKSYMLYTCAYSLHICERCYTKSEYGARHLALLPLKVLAPMPTMSTKTIEYVGEQINMNWTIRLCRICRISHFMGTSSGTYVGSTTFLQLEELRHKYPSMLSIPTLKNLYQSQRDHLSYEKQTQALPMKHRSQPHLYLQTPIPLPYDRKLACEDYVVEQMYKFFGGDIGIQCSSFSAAESDSLTRERIILYRQRE